MYCTTVQFNSSMNKESRRGKNTVSRGWFCLFGNSYPAVATRGREKWGKEEELEGIYCSTRSSTFRCMQIYAPYLQRIYTIGKQPLHQSCVGVRATWLLHSLYPYTPHFCTLTKPRLLEVVGRHPSCSGGFLNSLPCCPGCLASLLRGIDSFSLRFQPPHPLAPSM